MMWAQYDLQYLYHTGYCSRTQYWYNTPWWLWTLESFSKELQVLYMWTSVQVWTYVIHSLYFYHTRSIVPVVELAQGNTLKPIIQFKYHFAFTSFTNLGPLCLCAFRNTALPTSSSRSQYARTLLQVVAGSIKVMHGLVYLYQRYRWYVWYKTFPTPLQLYQV